MEHEFGGIPPGDFLDHRGHWSVTIRGLSLYNHGQTHFTPADFKFVCLDLLYVGNGDVAGEGPNILHIARENANHFVPLFHAASLGGWAGSTEVSESLRAKGVTCPKGVQEMSFGPVAASSSGLTGRTQVSGSLNVNGTTCHKGAQDSLSGSIAIYSGGLSGSTQSSASLRAPGVTFHKGAQETSSGSIQPTGWYREKDVCIRVSGRYYQIVDVCEFSAGSLIDVLRQVVANGFDCDIQGIHALIAEEFPAFGPGCNLDLVQQGEVVLFWLFELAKIMTCDWAQMSLLLFVWI